MNIRWPSQEEIDQVCLSLGVNDRIKLGRYFDRITAQDIHSLIEETTYERYHSFPLARALYKLFRLTPPTKPIDWPVMKAEALLRLRRYTRRYSTAPPRRA